MSTQWIEQAYVQYGAMVYRRCLRWLKRRAPAEDAMQEVFMRVARYSGGFLQADSRLAWLYRVSDNCCFDWIKKNKRYIYQEEMSYLEPAQNCLIESNLIHKTELIHFLSGLSEQQRTIAIMHFIDACTQEEIAKHCGLTRQTVAKKIQQLMQHIQYVINLEQSESVL